VPAFDGIWEALTAAHVARYLPHDEVLAAALKAAVEQDTALARAARQTPAARLGLETYHELRKAMPRTPLCYVAIELCLRLDSAAVLAFARAPHLGPFAERVALLPTELRRELGQLDAARVSGSLEPLESWLAQATAAGAEASELFVLLGVLEQEEVGTRVRLETDLVAAILPEASADCAKLRARANDLFEAVRRAVQARSARS
jgi:hypothetical protein